MRSLSSFTQTIVSAPFSLSVAGIKTAESIMTTIRRHFCPVERTEILSVPAMKADDCALQDARMTPVSISMADSLAVCRIAV